MTLIAREGCSCSEDSRFAEQATSKDVTCLRSEELRRKLALATEPAPDHERVTVRSYGRYLQVMHDVTRASVPLMHAAEAALSEDDERHEKLTRYFRKHIDEESGHVELVLSDLEELGIPRAESLRRRPNPYAAAAVGAQYYWIAHHSPIALLGYIAALEGNPPGPATIEAIRSVLPQGVDSLRALRVHAEADPGHSATLYDLVDDLNLSDKEAELLGLSALQTLLLLEEAHGYARLSS